MTSDTRIVYGARCTWWDSIDKVAHNGLLPCCPHCGGVLYENRDAKEWWDSVDAFEAKGHPGYHDFIEWLRGKCFPNKDAAKAAYESATRKLVAF